MAMEGADKVGVSRDPRVRIRLACRGGLTKGRNRDGSGLSALGERENASLLQVKCLSAQHRHTFARCKTFCRFRQKLV